MYLAIHMQTQHNSSTRLGEPAASMLYSEERRFLAKMRPNKNLTDGSLACGCTTGCIFWSLLSVVSVLALAFHRSGVDARNLKSPRYRRASHDKSITICHLQVSQTKHEFNESPMQIPDGVSQLYWFDRCVLLDTFIHVYTSIYMLFLGVQDNQHFVNAGQDLLKLHQHVSSSTM